MNGCKTCVTPGDPQIKLTKSMQATPGKDSSEETTVNMAQIPYRGAVGSLMFLMHKA
jgi:hypothetical protein